jgi:hypothetical protein
MRQSSGIAKTRIALAAMLIGLVFVGYSLAAAVVGGELKKWHTVTVTFDGPTASESDTATFLNYRLNVTFSKGATSYVVPGYFAADGNAAVSGATSGAKWRVNFCPNEIGDWTYTASFKTGANIAVDLASDAGTADATIDGQTGTITIADTDKKGGVDFRGKGMLRYIGQHYLQWAETENFFVKGGCNSPDNIFAYADFDNTPPKHAYAPHAADWTASDASWNGKGKALLGAINYLSATGLNSQCVRVMNLADAATGDVYPWVDSGSAPWNNAAALEKFDCSKLDQWEIVFEHMTKKGVLINISMAKLINQSLFEFAEGMTDTSYHTPNPFALSRKLFYREMVARFGHHCGLVWNLIEERDEYKFVNNPSGSLSTDQVIQFGNYLQAVDPYKHLVVCGSQMYTPYPPYFLTLINDSTNAGIRGVAVMDDLHSAYEYPRTLWNVSTSRNKPFITFQDQVQVNSVPGVTVTNDSALTFWRIDVLWPQLFAGGSGVEFNVANQGRAMEDFRSYDSLWKMVVINIKYMNTLPLNLVRPNNVITADVTRLPYLQVGADSLFVIRMNTATDKFFNLSALKTGTTFTVKWFNPKTGIYEKGTMDTMIIPNAQKDRTAYGFPPGITDWTQWTQSIDWILELRNVNYPESPVKFGVTHPAKATPMLKLVGTTVQFTIPSSDRVSLDLMSIDGAKVRTIFNGRMTAGRHTVSLDPTSLANGVYFITMTQGSKRYIERYVKMR